MHTVFFDFQFANDVERATVVGWTIVGIPITGRLHRTRDIAEFRHISYQFLCPSNANVLDEDSWIRRSSKSFGRNLHPPHLSLGARKLKSVDVGRRIKTSRNIAGQRNILCLSRQVVRFGFG